MIFIILNIVKWVFICLGLLIALILFVLALVLFPAVRYNIKGTVRSEAGLYNFKIKVTFLLGIVRCLYNTDEEGNDKFKIKLLCFRVNKHNKNNEVKVKKAKRKNSGKKENDKKQSFIERVRNMIDKANSWQSNENGDILIIIKHTIKLVYNLLRAFKHYKYRITGIIGMDSPDKTGYLTGIVSIIEAWTGLNIDMEWDFNEKRLEAEILARGKTSVFKIIWPIVVWALRKPIWDLIKPGLFKKNKERYKKKDKK